MAEFHGWRDADGGVMFVADGVRHPVLVHVGADGDEEHVLANFTSVEGAVMFQDWFDQSFEATAHANKKMTDHIRTLYKATPDG